MDLLWELWKKNRVPSFIGATCSDGGGGERAGRREAARFWCSRARAYKEKVEVVRSVWGSRRNHFRRLGETRHVFCA